MRNLIAFVVSALVFFSLALVLTMCVNMYVPRQARMVLAALEGAPVFWLSVLVRRRIAKDS